MRMKRKPAAWLLLCGLLLLPANGHTRAPLVLSLIEYPPLSSAALNGFGIAPAIVRAAFEKTGIPVTYQFYPPARAFTMAKTGQVGGLVGWVRSDEREQWFVFTDPFFEAPLVFFHLKSIPFDWKTCDDLTDLRIGITVKNYYGPDFHTAMDAGKLLVDEAPTDIIQFDKLLHGRIDLVPMNFYVGYGFIQGRYNTQTILRFTHHPWPLKISRYHVLISKAVPDCHILVEKFNKGLSLLKEKDEVDELIRQNILVPAHQ